MHDMDKIRIQKFLKAENLSLVKAAGRDAVSSTLRHDRYADVKAGDKQVSLAEVEVQTDQTEVVGDSAE